MCRMFPYSPRCLTWIQSTQGSTFVANVDMARAYWQLPIAPESLEMLLSKRSSASMPREDCFKKAPTPGIISKPWHKTHSKGKSGRYCNVGMISCYKRPLRKGSWMRSRVSSASATRKVSRSQQRKPSFLSEVPCFVVVPSRRTGSKSIAVTSIPSWE